MSITVIRSMDRLHAWGKLLPLTVEFMGRPLTRRDVSSDLFAVTVIYACHDFFVCPESRDGLYASLTFSYGDPLEAWFAEAKLEEMKKLLAELVANDPCPVRSVPG